MLEATNIQFFLEIWDVSTTMGINSGGKCYQVAGDLWPVSRVFKEREKQEVRSLVLPGSVHQP